MISYSPNDSGVDAAVMVRRFVNDETAERASRFAVDHGQLFEFVCECGNLACDAVVEMTIAEYRVLRPGSIVAH